MGYAARFCAAWAGRAPHIHALGSGVSFALGVDFEDLPSQRPRAAAASDGLIAATAGGGRRPGCGGSGRLRALMRTRARTRTRACAYACVRTRTYVYMLGYMYMYIYM